MPRTRKGAARRRKHKRILKAARGFFGAGSRRYRVALDKTFRAGVSATRDRKLRKRNFRRLWITRITAACRQRGLRYNEFIFGLTEANVALNRKMLSEIAVADPAAFDAIVAAAKDGAVAALSRARQKPAAAAKKPEKPQAAPARARKAAKKAVKKAAKKPDDKGAKKPKKEPAAKRPVKAAAKDVKKAAKKAAKKTAKKAVKKAAKKADKNDS